MAFLLVVTPHGDAPLRACAVPVIAIDCDPCEDCQLVGVRYATQLGDGPCPSCLCDAIAVVGDMMRSIPVGHHCINVALSLKIKV